MAAKWSLCFINVPSIKFRCLPGSQRKKTDFQHTLLRVDRQKLINLIWLLNQIIQTHFLVTDLAINNPDCPILVIYPGPELSSGNHGVLYSVDTILSICRKWNSFCNFASLWEVWFFLLQGKMSILLLPSLSLYSSIYRRTRNHIWKKLTFFGFGWFFFWLCCFLGEGGGHVTQFLHDSTTSVEIASRVTWKWSKSLTCWCGLG